MIITGSRGTAFLASAHGVLGCQTCHGGPDDFTFGTKAEAHVGVVHDPSTDPDKCLGCHATAQGDVAAVDVDGYKNGLHLNLWGYTTLIEQRGNCTFVGSGYEEGFGANCAGCHATCGQCHVSRPNSVGGGFPKIGGLILNSHTFLRTPHFTEQCTACHGSRIGVDFLGEDPAVGNAPDVHRSQESMKCEACHGATEIHGDSQHDGDHYNHRYEVKTMPRCEDCHGTLAANDYHDKHVNGSGSNLQCQVCHSQPYKNCTNCHNLGSGEKVDKYAIDPSVILLKIAKNPRTDTRGEYDYTLVRHVPVDPGTYADWGLTLETASYVSEPTWKYTSPHNILLQTPQTTVSGEQTCAAACHNTSYYLKEADLFLPDGITALPDYEANIGLVIPDKR